MSDSDLNKEKNTTPPPFQGVKDASHKTTAVSPSRKANKRKASPVLHHKKAKCVIAIYIVMVVFICLYPPWSKHFLYGNGTTPYGIPAEYHLIYSPPEPTPRWFPTVDVTRLAIELFGLTVVAGGVFFIFCVFPYWDDRDGTAKRC